MTGSDPELGPVRYCRRCDEWWPADREFWQFRPSGTIEGCRACKNETARRWRERHDADPERRAARLGQMAAKRAEHYRANRDAINERRRARGRAYYHEHKDDINERRRSTEDKASTNERRRERCREAYKKRLQKAA